jgi:hypothetical protein
MPKSRKVSFTATKHVSKKVDVVFRTRSGEKVAFEANKRVPKQAHVSFYTKKTK